MEHPPRTSCQFCHQSNLEAERNLRGDIILLTCKSCGACTHTPLKMRGMKERKANILSSRILTEADAVCITTNGVIKNNGEAVMGAGIAKSAKMKWPTIPLQLAGFLKSGGNHVYKLRTNIDNPEQGSYNVVSFPTKHHWRDKSDPDLIVRSAKELAIMAGQHRWTKVFLPHPGCSNGGLEWSFVKQLLTPNFDERFIICHL